MKLRALLLVLLLTACGESTDVDSDGRVKYGNPLGFSLRHEPGFQVSFQKGSYIQIQSQDGASRGIVFPFMANEAKTAEACLAKAPEMFADIFPQAKLVSTRQTKQQPDEAIAEFSSQAGSALGLCSVDGSSGMLYLAITPDGVKSKMMTTLIETFQTVSFDEPGKITSSMVSTDWVDPLENAFRIKAPKGWKVEGGLFRFSSVDTRIHIRMSSPDGVFHVGYGDKEIPPYSAQLGQPDGGQYNPGYGTVMTVKRFISGGEYATEYAAKNAEVLGCPGGAPVGKELDELTQQLQQAENQSQALIRKQVSAGEATITCTKDGQEHLGYIFAKVTLTPDNAGIGTGTWFAEVSGFTAPKNRADDARAYAIATYQSFQWEPAWQQAQGQTTLNTAQIVSTTANHIANTLNRQYAKTQVVMDNIFRKWSNATLGQTDVADVATGETYKIASGKNYYWRKAGTNVVAGTNQYERPDIDFRPLLEY